MTSIELTVTGATARARVDGVLTDGMVGLPVTIRYDSDWDGLTKTLVCKAGGSRPDSAGIVKAILNVENEAVVAPEVMIARKFLYLGLEGRNAEGTLVIPTVWASCGRIQSSADVEDDASVDYTLPIWAQLQGQIEELKQTGVSDERIAEAVQNGFADWAARIARPRNLLDNSDFSNPVNQRNVTGTLGNYKYTIDRWMISSSSGNGYFDIKPNVGIGLNVNGDSWMTINQRLTGLDKNKKYTIAFQDGYGNIYVNQNSDIVWSDNYCTARIILSSGTRTIVWAALYEGEYTAETLPEYQPKGYGAELVECRRYYREYGDGLAFWIQSGTMILSLPFDIPMRVNPTVSLLQTSISVNSVYGGSGNYEISNMSFSYSYAKAGGITFVQIAGTWAAAPPNGYYRFNNASPLIALSADL